MTPKKLPFVLILRAHGNPDFYQFADVAPRKRIAVESLAAAVQVAREYRDGYNLGSGNWDATVETADGTPYARIGYNLRCWGPGRYPTPEIIP